MTIPNFQYKTNMNQFFFTLSLSFLLLNSVFSQQEKPSKILSYDSSKKLDSYLTGKNWEKRGIFTDDVDGDYHLYRTKTAAKGYAYLAVYLERFMHYQVFYVEKKDYSKVLNYEDFLKMPEGKSEYNRSIENETFNIKSIEFNDPTETRNINMFYGKVVADTEVINGLTEEEDVIQDENDFIEGIKESDNITPEVEE